MNRLLDLLPAFPGKRIVVLGDLILDEYIIGGPSRVSREAPIVILEFNRRTVLPGGGTAPASNIQSLGAQAIQVGVIGADKAGDELRAALAARGVDTRASWSTLAGPPSSSRASWPKGRGGCNNRSPASIPSTGGPSPGTWRTP